MRLGNKQPVAEPWEDEDDTEMRRRTIEMYEVLNARVIELQEALAELELAVDRYGETPAIQRRMAVLQQQHANVACAVISSVVDPGTIKRALDFLDEQGGGG